MHGEIGQRGILSVDTRNKGDIIYYIFISLSRRLFGINNICWLSFVGPSSGRSVQVSLACKLQLQIIYDFIYIFISIKGLITQCLFSLHKLPFPLCSSI